MVRGKAIQPAAGLRLEGDFDGTPYAFSLSHGESHLGSAATNELVLPVPEVSRRHAVIRVDGTSVAVEDLRSKNGTFVNGRRVVKATIAVGDLVCFGVVVLKLVRAGSDDGLLAITIESPATPRRPQEVRWTKTQTPTAGDAMVPARWLRVADRVGAELAANRAAVPLALEIVMTGVGADGAALVSWGVDADPVIEHTCGLWRSSEALGRLCDEAGAAAAQGLGGRAEVFVALNEAQPLAASVHSPGEGGSRALVVTGSFPQREACGTLLGLVLRIIGRAEGKIERAATPRGRRPVPDLVFPDGYVPGRSEAMRSVYHQLRALLKGDLRVLITGETGVGKEHIARILHTSSPRAAGPFVAVNCTAIATELLEAELFGIEAGVATGVTARVGLMVTANGGSIFLDEIGEMSPALQAKLLRALEQREVRPVGARAPIPLDVRVISATNQDLQVRIKEGRFRADLFYRIAGYTLAVPPLRERREDVPALVEHFLRKYAAEADIYVRGISASALRALEAANWPGNVRELSNEVQRVVALCLDGQAITTALLSPALIATGDDSRAIPTGSGLDLSERRRKDEMDRELIKEALARTDGNKAAAARLLTLSPHGLRKMMRRLGLAD